MAKKGTSRAAQGAGSIRKKTVMRKGQKYTYWEARVTIGTDPGSGKQIQKSFSGKTQKEVREKMQAAAVMVNDNDYLEPSKLTVKQWFETWLDDYSSDKKYLTVVQYRSMSETHIFPALGAVKLEKLTAPQLQKFYNELAKTGKTVKVKDEETGEVTEKKEPLSPKTIRNIHGIISKALNTAIDQGMIKNNVSERVTIPKVIQEEIEPLTEDQQRAFLEAIMGHKYEWLYKVILFTGLRESEAIGLTWDCVDFKKHTLKVYRQLQKRDIAEGGYTFAPLKNSKTRYIKLSLFVVKVFEMLQRQQIESRFQAGELWQGWQNEEERKAGLIFTNERGEHLSTATVYNNFKRIMQDIGAPAVRVHDLRHTFAVNSLQNGDDYKILQENLGHATAAFTLNVYGHVSERMREESAARMQEFITSLGAV